jgi:hypothetical protein
MFRLLPITGYDIKKIKGEGGNVKKLSLQQAVKAHRWQ